MMLARTALLVAIATLAIGSTARADGATALESFTSVVLQGSLDVRFVQSAAPSFRVVKPNASTVVTHRLAGGILTLVAQGGGGRGTLVEVACPHLAKLEINGAGDVEIRGFSGKELDVKAAGSGDLLVSGTVETLTVKILGSADMDLDGLTAKHATVGILGSGDVKVRATGTLKIQILGAGDVTYRGGAKVTTQILGSGDVTKGD